jgi:hypothetical protein
VTSMLPCRDVLWSCSLLLLCSCSHPISNPDSPPSPPHRGHPHPAARSIRPPWISRRTSASPWHDATRRIGSARASTSPHATQQVHSVLEVAR